MRVESSDIYSNTASLSAGFENHAGGVSVPVVLLNSHLHDNHADIYGGAIGNYGVLSIQNSALDANTAAMKGGAVYDYEGGQVDILKSTLSGNTSVDGAGIFSELFIHNASKVSLTNSTISGNTASEDAGGIYAQGGSIKLFSTTVAGNQVLAPLGTTHGQGGGIFQAAPATIDAQNLLLADNTHRVGAALPEKDDCFGAINLLGYNLVEDIANCTLSGAAAGLIIGSDPRLGPLQLNGGSQKTQAPLAGSPAIDAGQTPACLDPNGAAITGDERGFRRPLGAACDIGAVEFSPYGALIPIVRK